MKRLLDVRDLEVTIGAHRIVERLSFHIDAGETYALLGESGCGKSISALALMRLLPAAGRLSAGSVRLGDTDLRALSERRMREIRGGRMAMIFQEPMLALNPVFKVGHQIAEALSLHRKLQGQAARDEGRMLLESVGVPDPQRRLDSYPFELSGGLRQRVMIAMALAARPELLIADEPTTALDVTIQAQVLAILRELRDQRGMGMLLITHDLGVVAENADRIGVMYAGELLEEGSRRDFFMRPQHPYSRMLFAALPQAGRQRLLSIPGQVPAPGSYPGGCRFAARCPYAVERCRTESPAWREIDGQRVRCHFAGELGPLATAGTGSEESTATKSTVGSDTSVPVLAVEDLKVHFPIRRGFFRRAVGHVRAVDGVTLTLQAGRTLALVGESGCGKTTVGKAILRLIEPTSGSVHVQGSRVDAARMDVLRRNAQMVFQDPFGSLNPRMRVADIFLEGMEALDVGSKADREQAVARLLEQVGLPADAGGRYPHAFSGGQRQRIAIARALAVSPRLLICDEPTSALDVSVQAQILNLLKDLQDRLGLAYLFITHNLSVVGYLAHEIAVMYLGRIVERGPAAEVLARPLHPYTQALVAAIPKIDASSAHAAGLGGEQPSPIAPPPGCHFHPRCPIATDICRREYPAETPFPGGRGVSCHHPGEAKGSNS